MRAATKVAIAPPAPRQILGYFTLVGIKIVDSELPSDLAKRFKIRNLASGAPAVLLARLGVDRTKAGLTTMHIYTHTRVGAVLPFEAVDGSLTERSSGLGPVNFSFANAGPGRGTAAAVVVPAPGTWTLTAQVRTDETTDYSATTTYTVRSP